MSGELKVGAELAQLALKFIVAPFGRAGVAAQTLQDDSMHHQLHQASLGVGEPMPGVVEIT